MITRTLRSKKPTTKPVEAYGNMTNNHGDPPLDAESTWTKVQSYAAKNKELKDKRNKKNEESNQNEAQEEEIEAPGIGTNAPRRTESHYVTRINFKVIPEKNAKTLSVLNSIIRIMAATKFADPTTRIIATDKNGNETEFAGAKSMPTNNEENREFINQFVEEPRITARNELVGLITMRSEVNFREIKRSNQVKQGLNEQPRIFLTPNYLSVVTPVLVGFFVNNYPRHDSPETFHVRVDNYIRTYDPEIRYQVDLGPIWAKGRKMTVYKIMTSLENKENLRAIMNYHENYGNIDEYVCAAEFFSLTDEEKAKMIIHQVEFCNKNKSIFIHGIKDIYVPVRIDAEEGDEVGQGTVAKWLNGRLTSYGKKMFTRVYQACNGTVELYVEAAHHKEAMDWARLSTSEIAKELNEKSMEEFFIDPQDAYDKMAVQPEWKPHTLGKRIEHLVTPDATTKTNHARKQAVTLSYDEENTKAEPTKGKESYQKKGTKVKEKEVAITKIEQPNMKAKATESELKGQAGSKWGPPPETITLTATQQEDESTVTPSNMPKFGQNKYKVAAAAQNQRMQNIEETLQEMLSLQKEAKVEMAKFKDFQIETIDTVQTIMDEVESQGIKAKKNKEDTDNKLMQFRKSIALFDSMMNTPTQQQSESPRRKMPRPSLPPEEDNMKIAENSDEERDNDNINTNKKAPKSDDKTKVVAGGN